MARDASPVAFLVLLAVSLAWGLAFVAIKVLLGVMRPLDLTVWRFVLAVVGFGGAFVVLRLRDRASLRVRRDHWPWLLLLGFLAVPAYHLSLNYGEAATPAGVAGLIVGTGPVWLAAMAPFVLGERLAGRRIGGILLAFLGTALIVAGGESGSFGVEPSRAFVLGALTVLLAPVSWAAYSVVAKRLLVTYSSTALTVVVMAIGTAMVLPALATRPPGDVVPTLTVGEWGWLAFLGVVASFLGYVGWNYGVHRMDASRAGAFVYVVPVSAVGWSWWLLNEPLTPAILVGGAITVVGVVVASYGRRPRPVGPSAPSVDAAPATASGPSR